MVTHLFPPKEHPCLTNVTLYCSNHPPQLRDEHPGSVDHMTLTSAADWQLHPPQDQSQYVEGGQEIRMKQS